MAVREEYHCWAAAGAARPTRAETTVETTISAEIEAFMICPFCGSRVYGCAHSYRSATRAALGH